MEEGIISRETRMEIIQRNIRNALFNTYYSLQSRYFCSTFFYFLLITFETLQIASLLLFHINYSTFDYSILYSPISYTINILRMTLCLFIEHQGITSIVFIYLFLVYFFIHCLVFAYFSKFSFEHKQSSQIHVDIFLKVLFHIDVLIITIFAFPFYICALSFFQCNESNTLLNYPELSCDDVLYYFNAFFAGVGIVAYTLLGYLNCLFLNDNMPIGKLPWSNSFNHIKSLMLILKLVLAFHYVIIYNLSFNFKIFSSFIICVTITVLRFFNQFFHRKSMGSIIICYEYAIALYSIIGIINQYSLFDYSMERFLIEIVTGISFGLLFIFVIEKHKDNLTFINKRSFIYEYIGYGKIMELMSQAKDIQHKELLGTFFLSILQKHRFKCNDSNCKCGDYCNFISDVYRDSRSTSNHMNTGKYELRQLNNQGTTDYPLETNIHNNNNQNSNNNPNTRNSNMMTPNQQGNNIQNFKTNTITSTTMIAHSNVTSMNNKLWNNTSDTEKQNFIKKHTMTSSSTFSDGDDFNMINISLTTELKLSIPEVIYGIIRFILEGLIIVYPKSPHMKIFFAYLMIFYLNNNCKALYELMKIPIQNQNIMIQYEIFLCKKEIEAKMQKEFSTQARDTISMETILLFNRLTNQIIDLISITSKDVIRFWEEILGFSAVIKFMEDNHSISVAAAQFHNLPTYSKEHKSKQAVYKYAVSIARHMVSMEKIYYQLRKNANFRNIIVFKLYASFLEKVICNEKQSKEIMLFIENSKCNFNKKGNETYIFIDGKINLDDIGSCVVSGDLGNLGRIIHCNVQFGNIFKYEKEQLKFEIVSKICPSYIGEHHNEFILRYYETGKRHLMGMNKIIFGLRSDGVLIPVVSFIKTVPNLEDSIRFIGLFKVLSRDHPFWVPSPGVDCEFAWRTKNVSFILATDKGNVFGITKDILKMYGIPLNVLMNNAATAAVNGNVNEEELNSQKETKILNVKQIFPSFDFDNKEQITKLITDGCEMILDSSSLKKNYADFIESLQSGKSPLLKSLANVSESVLFKKSLVFVKMIELLFNDNKMKMKILKIVKMKTIQIKTKSTRSMYLNNLFKNLITKSVNLVEQPKMNIKIKTKASLKKFQLASVIQTPRNKDDNKRNSHSNSIHNKRGSNALGGISGVMRPYGNNISLKDSLKHFSIPLQAKVLLFVFVLVYLAYVAIGISEYLLSIKYSNEIIDYYIMYHSTNLRNLYLSLVILYFNTLIYYDNEIFKPPIFDRDIIIKKLLYDLGKSLELANSFDIYINTKDQQIQEIFNVELITTKVLNSNFTMLTKQETLGYTYGILLVKINALLTHKSFTDFKLENINDLFYLNKNFPKSPTATSTLVEIYYIIENYVDKVRFSMERVEDLMGQRLTEENIFFRQNRIVITYLPFAFVVFALFLCLVLLRTFTEYKIKILKVFYVVNKKYGYEVIRRCNLFLEYTANFTKYTKKDIDIVMKEMTLQSERTLNQTMTITMTPTQSQLQSRPSQALTAPNEATGGVGNERKTAMVYKTVQFDEEIGNLPSLTKKKEMRKTSTKALIHKSNGIGVQKTNSFKKGLMSSFNNPIVTTGGGIAGNNATSIGTTGQGINNSNNNNISSGTTPSKEHINIIPKKSISSIPQQTEPNAHTMLFWEREEKERQDSAEEEQIGEKVTHELYESKKALKKKMLIIVIYIIILLLCTAIYFIIAIVLNNQFDQEVTNTFPFFYYFSNRGWLFTNILILYRQMIMSNNITTSIPNYSSDILYTNADLTHAELFNLYLNQSYHIETQILLLTNSYLQGFNKEMLQYVIDIDHKLNSDQYCKLLQEYDNNFYETYQKDCEIFYQTNLGLKDNIQIIINYIQAQTIDFVDKPIKEVMKILEYNSTFINYDEIYISQAILLEMDVLKKGIESFIASYQRISTIQLVVFIIYEVFQIIVFGLIWRYLVNMLIKEKAILNIIPNEAIAMSLKVKKALQRLKVFN